MDIATHRRFPGRTARACALALVALAGAAACFSAAPAASDSPVPWTLTVRIVAVGLPDVAGVRQVGRFHYGGPIPGNPEFLVQTDAGRVLDPQRVMVAVGSNFGAPPADPMARPGSILSIDPRGARTVVVSPRFAAAGGQARDAGGAVQLYSAQSPAFGNARHNASARTAALTSVAGPRYISINNAFGRPWFANAPGGADGAGSISVVDPDGAPLANAPSDDAGGVFAGHDTNRRQVARGMTANAVLRLFNHRASPQLTAGSLDRAALGTAFLGASPDGSGLAVFASVGADGSVAQVHVQDGVDGLAPPGTVTRLPTDGGDGGVMGVAFKWNPERALYLADAGRDRIVVLRLDDDGRQFKVASTVRIAGPWLRGPVDLAAALPEIANPAFASHTTLAGGSDLYVANRADGSVVRMTQDGRPLARAEVRWPDGSPVGAGRIRAIAVSADAQRLWLTVQGPVPGRAGPDGALVELPAFDAGGVFATGHAARAAAPDHDPAATGERELVAAGERAFGEVYAPDTGLGPLFNERSCIACHPGPGGASTDDAHFARRVARMDEVTGRVTAIAHPNSPVARRRSTLELGAADAPRAALPQDANLVSLRMPLAVYDAGAIERVDAAAIEAGAVSKGDGIKGRVHRVAAANGETRIGRYGWKADIASLDEMVADAFGTEIGITSALAARPVAVAKDDGRLVRAVAAYLRALAPPPSRVAKATPP